MTGSLHTVYVNLWDSFPIEADGARLLRHGSKHDWYVNERTGKSQAVPRHREIKEWLARDIIKDLNTPTRNQ